MWIAVATTAQTEAAANELSVRMPYTLNQPLRLDTICFPDFEWPTFAAHYLSLPLEEVPPLSIFTLHDTDAANVQLLTGLSGQDALNAALRGMPPRPTAAPEPPPAPAPEPERPPNRSPHPGVHLVAPQNFDGAWPRLERVLQEWAERLQLEIYASCPHARQIPVDRQQVGPGVLNLYFWSMPWTPSSDASTRIAHVGDFELSSDGQGDAIAYRAAPDVTPLRDERGTVFAVLKGQGLYTLFDLPHSNAENAPDLLNYIMLRYSAETISPAERAALEEAQLKDMEMKCIDSMKTIYAGFSTHERDRLLRQATDQEATNASYRNELAEGVRRLRLYQTQLNALNTLQDGDQGRATRELAALRRLPFVKRVVGGTNRILVSVGNIQLTFERKVYDIGEFVIEYRLHNSGGLECYIQNRTRTWDHAYEHPHVHNSTPCLGNMAEVTDMIQNGDLAAATVILYNYLQSYNPGDAFVRVENHWPVVRELSADEPVDPPVAAVDPDEEELEFDLNP